jgi:hypothetical protein
MRLQIFARAVSIGSAAIAISTGIIVTLGYFFDFVELVNLRVVFLQWAIFLAAVGLLVGVINLFLVHMRKVRKGGMNAVYSVVLVAALVITFGLGVLFDPDHELPTWIFNNIQVPIEASLMASLAVSLAYASARLLQLRLNAFTVIFIGTALLVLLGTGSLPWGEVPLISGVIKPWIAQVPAVAGARGILLGVALGTVATGLRVLMGIDRPYGD